MTAVWNWLSGKKTYIVMVAALGYAVTQFWSGAFGQDELVRYVLAALGLGALRSGVAKS